VRCRGSTLLPSHFTPVPFLPSIDMLSGVHSRTVSPPPSGSGQPDQDHVPTAWFLTTSPVCSAVHLVTEAAAILPLRAFSLRVAGLLRPAANRGVHRVSGRRALLPGLAAILIDVFLPLEGLHPSSAVPCHHGLCPLDVLSTRCSDLPGSRCRSRRSIRSPLRVRLQGFALWMGPYRRAPLPTTDGLPFRGLLVPLQGPSITHTAFARFVTNSRAASADLSLFQSSALQWARSPRFRSRRSSS